jgi:CheY-like chemotaxis protein
VVVVQQSSAPPLHLAIAVPERPPNLTGSRVLVVEGDAEVRAFAAYVLQSCGAVVTPVADARTALDAAGRDRPDLVVTEVFLPAQDGYWLAEQLCAAGRRIPVIAMTALRPGQHAFGRPERFLSYVVKPVDPGRLCRAVSDALAQIA